MNLPLKKVLKRVYFICLLSSFTFISQISVLADTGLPLPRFVSLKSNVANLRTGPSKRYPIDWVYTYTNLPVKIISEYDDWRKIETQEGISGWLYKTLVHNKRSVAIENKVQKLYIKPNKSSRVRAYLERGVIAFLITCKNEWCHIATDRPKITGWIPQNALWGVFSGEFKE